MNTNKGKLIQILKAGLPTERLSWSVKGYSMYPLIQPGSKLILSTNLTSDQISVGDIVALIHQETIVAHRVVFIRKKAGEPFCFHTKGDKNLSFDKPILSQQILGKIVGIQKENNEFIDINRPLWRIVGLCICIVTGSGVYRLWHKLINNLAKIIYTKSEKIKL